MGGVRHSLLKNALFVQLSDASEDTLHSLVTESIAAQCHTEVIGGQCQRCLDMGSSLVINLVEADVKMFELGVYKQIPLSDLGTGFIFDHLTLDSIE